MDLGFLGKGLILGFSIAAPVGPIGVLCIRRTLAEGRLVGFISGLGAAVADAFYGALGGFGVSLVTSFLVQAQMPLRLIGGAFLGYLGVRTLRTRPSEQAAETKARGLASAFASICLLTLTNPMTILSFAAVFAGLGVANGSKNYLATALLVLGVFSGSALWWLLLSSGVGLFRHKVTPDGLRWINWLSGTVLLGFGLLSLAAVFHTAVLPIKR